MLDHKIDIQKTSWSDVDSWDVMMGTLKKEEKKQLKTSEVPDFRVHDVQRQFYRKTFIYVYSYTNVLEYTVWGHMFIHSIFR